VYRAYFNDIPRGQARFYARLFRVTSACKRILRRMRRDYPGERGAICIVPPGNPGLMLIHQRMMVESHARRKSRGEERKKERRKEKLIGPAAGSRSIVDAIVHVIGIA